MKKMKIITLLSMMTMINIGLAYELDGLLFDAYVF